MSNTNVDISFFLYFFSSHFFSFILFSFILMLLSFVLKRRKWIKNWKNKNKKCITVAPEDTNKSEILIRSFWAESFLVDIYGRFLSIILDRKYFFYPQQSVTKQISFHSMVSLPVPSAHARAQSMLFKQSNIHLLLVF